MTSKKNNKGAISWGAKVHTLNTVDLTPSAATTSSSSSSTSSSSPSSFRIQHIPGLTSSDYAASILKRIQNEFHSIVQKRGYKVTSVTEMSCNEDGYDYLTTGSGKKRGRKTRKMPKNVLGYNLCSTTHRIHLRLRHPDSESSFFPYEDIAGTMCHELAHCEVQAHNAKFFKLMDEIMQQYEVFLVRGLVVDKSGFPMGSSEAYTLGSGSGMNRNHQAAAAKAALERRKKLGFGGSYVLGGGLSYIQDVKRKENDQRRNGFNMYGTRNTSSSLSSTKSKILSSLTYLPPREAARIAAEKRVEERRRNDSMFCLPCDEIIEILNGSSDEEEDDDANAIIAINTNHNTIKRAQVEKRKTRSGNEGIVENIQPNVIDLLDDDDDDDDDDDHNSDQNGNSSSAQDSKNVQSTNQSWNCSKCTYTNSSTMQSCGMCDLAKDGSIIHTNNTTKKDIQTVPRDSTWTCHKCTFNSNKDIALACEICGTERQCNEEGKNTQSTIQKIVRQDFIENVKANETEKSKKEFNGFNIYGNDKRSTSTLDHLT